jgi:hypothetical protein
VTDKRGYPKSGNPQSAAEFEIWHIEGRLSDSQRLSTSYADLVIYLIANICVQPNRVTVHRE